MMSIACLLFNTVIVLMAVKYLSVAYYWVYVCVLLTNSIYTFLCTLMMWKKWGRKLNLVAVFLFAFPIKHLIPFLIAIPAIYFAFALNVSVILLAPLMVYLLMNWRDFSEVVGSVVKVVYHPNVVDL